MKVPTATAPARDIQDGTRRLSRHETHDLSMIIKDRTKVLERYAEEEAAKCLADFERKLATNYKFDEDEIWKKATEDALAEVRRAQEKIAAQCAKRGIPKDLSPRLEITWNGRGQAALEERRAELRRVARAEVEAMKKAAMTKIAKQSLDLRTQVVAMGLLTPDAKLFLESLAPIEDAMCGVDFGQIEARLIEQKRAAAKTNQRRLGYGGLYGDYEV